MNKITILFLLVLFSCDKKDIIFYPAPQLVLKSQYEGKIHYSEVIIIRNAPRDFELTHKYIENYNKRTLSKDSIQNRFESFDRSYYFESERTPVNFVHDQGGFISDRLEDHDYDFVASYRMKKCLLSNRNGNNICETEWSILLKDNKGKYHRRYLGSRCE